jgi:hypothetical protein
MSVSGYPKCAYICQDGRKWSFTRLPECPTSKRAIWSVRKTAARSRDHLSGTTTRCHHLLTKGLLVRIHPCDPIFSRFLKCLRYAFLENFSY